MKKVLAIVIAVFMLAAMTTVAFADFAMPAEITAANGVFTGGGDGIWPLDSGTYDPNLDSAGIPSGAYVIAVYSFDMTTFTGTNYDFPASIAGYTKVASVSAVKAGTYAEAVIGGYNYIILMEGTAAEPAAPADEPAAEPAPVVEPEPAAEPAAAVEPADEPAVTVTVEAPALKPYQTPSELTSAGAFELGKWPLDAGMYDPNLDDAGIPKGAYVYGLYSFDMTTFTGTNFSFPASLAGYTKAASVADVKAGTYAEAVIGGYNYIILIPEAGTAPATSDMTNLAPFAIVCVIAALGIVFAIPRKSKDN